LGKKCRPTQRIERLSLIPWMPGRGEKEAGLNIRKKKTFVKGGKRVAVCCCHGKKGDFGKRSILHRLREKGRKVRCQKTM